VPIFLAELPASILHLSDHDFKKGDTLYFACAPIFPKGKPGVVVGIKAEATYVSAKFIDWIVLDNL
jgi:hypothetical protein